MNRLHRSDIPIVIASIGPKNVELTAEVANGWQPIHFVPDRFQQVWGDALAAGTARRAARAGPARHHRRRPGGHRRRPGGRTRPARRPGPTSPSTWAAWGPRAKNFYNDLFRRYGWEEEAEKIQDLFLAGKRDEATAAVPDEYLDLATLCGPEAHVQERLKVYNEVGVTYLNIEPQGDDKLGTIEQIKAWVE